MSARRLLQVAGRASADSTKAEGGPLAAEHTDQHAAGERASGVTRDPGRSASSTSASSTSAQHQRTKHQRSAYRSTKHWSTVHWCTTPRSGRDGSRAFIGRSARGPFKEEQCRSASADVAA
jgi:hypothetical protein